MAKQRIEYELMVAVSFLRRSLEDLAEGETVVRFLSTPALHRLIIEARPARSPEWRELVRLEDGRITRAKTTEDVASGGQYL